MKRSPFTLLGVEIDALSISELNALIEQSIELNRKWIIANHNLHSVYLHHHDAKMRKFYTCADYVHIDGMALVLLGRLLKLPLERNQRVTYADWVWSLMEEAHRKNWRIFYLGSKPGVAGQGANILRQKFPGLQIQTEHGFFDMQPNSPDNQAVVAKINSYKPDVLMVGMGMPRQEHWILENLEHLTTHAILPSGACLDYVAGAIPTPPRWMGKVGLEWLYRLVSEPKRLWKRYLVEPWFLVKLFLQDLWTQTIQLN
jgi:N-acetylglucosaminyldiphosphoundecaprenol N-acetyl-beta-D-mannosaminyltransferase